MIVITGDAGVGKSALLSKFQKPNQEWEAFEHKATIGVDFVRKPLEIEGRKVLLQSWDTAGQERFRTITTSYYRAAQGAIICYDCTNISSYKNVKGWIKDFREKAKQGAPIMIVANKVDLMSKEQSQVSQSRQLTISNPRTANAAALQESGGSS